MQNKILIRGFNKPRKFYTLLFVVILFSVFFLSSIYAFYETLLTINYGENKYGHQYGTIFQADTKLIENIASDDNVTEHICFEREYVELDDGRQCVLDKVSDGYFSFTEYEMVDGTFPANKNEICCESWFLFQLGIPYDEMIGSTVSIGTVQYTVTGIFKVNRLWYTYSNEDVHCFTTEPEHLNSIAFATEDIEACESLMERYQSQFMYSEYNNNNWVIIGNTQMIRTLYIAIFTIIVAAVIVILSHCISMILFYHKKNIGIYRLTGISTGKVAISLYLSIMRIVLTAFLISMILTFISALGIIQLYQKIYETDMNYIFHEIQLETVVMVPLLITVIYCISIAIIIYVKSHETKISNVKNNHSVSVKKRSLVHELSDSYIAKRHMKTAWISNIFTFLSICLIIIAFPTVDLYFKSMSDTTSDYDGYDYVAEVDRDTLMFNAHESLWEFMQTIENPDIEGVKASPLYSSTFEFEINKNCISNDYLELLSQNSDLHYQISNPYETNVTIPFFMIALTDEQQKELGISLQDDKMIMYRYLANYGNPKISGLNLDILSSFQISDDYTIDIQEIKESYTGKLPTEDIATVFVVNINTYTKATNNQAIPSKVYFNVDSKSEDKFTSLFSGKNYVNLINVHEKKANSQLISMNQVIYMIISFMMIVFVLFNCIIVIYMRANYHIKEYAVMRAVGISKKNISIMIGYELFSILLSALIISDIVACIIAKFFIDKLTRESIDLTLNFPYIQLILCNVMILCSVVIAFSLFIRNFWCKVAKQKLSS